MRGRPESLQVPADDWRAILATVVHQRLTGLAMAMAEDCLLALTDEQTEELLTWHREFMLNALTLERELLALASSFEDAGMEFVVLKGPAVAHTCYPDSSWRPFGDLDILVHVRDFQRASGVLAELGFGRVFPEPRPRFVERFGHTALHRTHEGFEIDLHRTLIPGPFGQWIDPEELILQTVSFSLGGRSLRRLNDTALLLHACLHASLGARPPLVLPVRDVAQVIASSQLDWELLAAWLKRWRLHAVLR
ncbi:MAG: nucleotidyltransferase family protein, partial [Actinomycetota bacterium]